MSVIFLFVDGVGLGDESPDNPLAGNRWKSLQYITGGLPLTRNANTIKKDNHLFKAVDATLGVKGLPQSGTGQAALFSGENAAQDIGKHFGPFPHSGNKHLLQDQSLFHKARVAGKSCAFINAYPDIFFRKAEERNRWSCTTLMSKSAGIKLRSTKDIKQGKAITAGITQEAWRNYLSIDVPVIEPETAAKRLINQSVNIDIVLHEYYLTDKAGHGRAELDTDEIIGRYDRFLIALLRERPDQATIVLCSDHGNVEDLSVKTHTRNRVPLAAIGPGAPAFHQAESIMDVTPGIINILD